MTSGPTGFQCVPSGVPPRVAWLSTVECGAAVGCGHGPIMPGVLGLQCSSLASPPHDQRLRKVRQEQHQGQPSHGWTGTETHRTLQRRFGGGSDFLSDRRLGDRDRKADAHSRTGAVCRRPLVGIGPIVTILDVLILVIRVKTIGGLILQIQHAIEQAQMIVI